MLSFAKSKTAAVLAFALLAVLALTIFAQSSRLDVTAYAQTFTVPCTITTYGNAWDGNLTFGLMRYDPTNTSNILQSYLVNMRTNGQVLNLRQFNSSSGDYFELKYINQSTVLFEGETGLATHFWNMDTNQTVDFPNIRDYHHDICYNPVNGHFLMLKYDYRNVNGTYVLYDIIEEADSAGNIVRTWYAYDHVPLSWASKFNETIRFNNITYLDLTHCNSIMWNYQEDIVYLNSRHLDTFWKINMTSGNIIWGCGKHGNFTMLSTNGTSVSSLWYHSHATHGIGSGLYIMFDNDFNNETNPNDAHSRILMLSLNETSMVAQEVWSWEAPVDYWSRFWGKADVLPNGNRIGTFGTFTKPYNNTIGAAIAEVNVEGQLVRTWVFPSYWGIYRVIIGGLVANSLGMYPEPTVIPEFSSFAMMMILIATSFAVSVLKFEKRCRRLRVA